MAFENGTVTFFTVDLYRRLIIIYYVYLRVYLYILMQNVIVEWLINSPAKTANEKFEWNLL